VHINDVRKNIESTVRLFADCITYMKILSNNDVKNLQIELNRLGEWAFENQMIINPTKSKAVYFWKARVTRVIKLFVRRHSNP
jgi:hypothetical protein